MFIPHQRPAQKVTASSIVVTNAHANGDNGKIVIRSFLFWGLGFWGVQQTTVYRTKIRGQKSEGLCGSEIMKSDPLF
jgi:hypothetical protein